MYIALLISLFNRIKKQNITAHQKPPPMIPIIPNPFPLHNVQQHSLVLPVFIKLYMNEII